MFTNPQRLLLVKCCIGVLALGYVLPLMVRQECLRPKKAIQAVVSGDGVVQESPEMTRHILRGHYLMIRIALSVHRVVELGVHQATEA